MTTRGRRLLNLRQVQRTSSTGSLTGGTSSNTDQQSSANTTLTAAVLAIQTNDAVPAPAASEATTSGYNTDDDGASSIASSSARTPTTPTLRERLKKIEAATRSPARQQRENLETKDPQEQDPNEDTVKLEEKPIKSVQEAVAKLEKQNEQKQSPVVETTPPMETNNEIKDNGSSVENPPPPSPPSDLTSEITVNTNATDAPAKVVEPPPPPPQPKTTSRMTSKTQSTKVTPRVSQAPPPQPRASSPPVAASEPNVKSKSFSATKMNRKTWCKNPSLDPYIGKLERYELFCTNQSYYLVGCNKQNSQYRVIKMDRTLIERPVDQATLNAMSGGGGASSDNVHMDNKGRQPTQVHTSTSNASQTSDTSVSGMSHHNGNVVNTMNTAAMGSNDAAHTPKPTLRKLSEFLVEDPNVYSQSEIQEMLDMIHDGNRLLREDHRNVDGMPSSQNGNNGGGLKPIAKAYGIVGFIKFLDCYYLTLITRRAKVGSIGGNGIYTIKATETFPIKPAERVPGSHNEVDIHADPSSVLLNMWNRGKRSVGLGLTNREIAELRYQGLYQVVDLTKNFFFSYTYDLTRSLQENFLANTSQPFPPPPFKDMFAWNYFLTRELENCTNTLSSFQWVMPIIHGAYVQRKLNDYGRSLNVILLARRSRHFAGTRYLKRGVSEQGKVANDVEHEQILHDESRAVSNGVFSSYLQVRGSIPTFWTQESSVTMPKPPIELNRVDPTYTATQLHFEDLMQRYGSPIVVLDLVKQSEKREREVRVGNEFRHGIEYINTHIDSNDHKIRYCALDYSHISKHRNLDVSTSLNEVSTWAVNQTGFFCSSAEWKITKGGKIEPFSEKDYQAASLFPEKFGVPTFPMEQTGVLRTNCIDCLDRTNVAQFSAGVEAMEQQLVVMGIRSNPKLDPSSNVVRVLIDMYVDIGDHIALQYGGSEAHKKVTAERSESIVGPIGKHKELLTSIRRYYSNAFTDRLKQDAMNLFLGYYIPYRHTVPLWEMETDYYLHNRHIETGSGMRAFQESFGVLGWDSLDANERGNEKGTTTARRNVKLIGSKGRNESMSNTILPEKSVKIQKVRDRCDIQNKALSNWWKTAIQKNVQQRMWMQLGRSPTEPMLPPRFERLYQPEKLAQFDRFFARSWATPVRRSHSAQHSTDAEEELSEYRRNVYREQESSMDPEKQDNKVGEDLDQVISKHGFVPKKRSSLRRLVQEYDIIDDEIPSSASILSEEENTSGKLPYRYIGDTNRRFEKPRDEYLRCVQPSEYLESSRYNPIAFEEFKESLHALSLNANDVNEIHDLSESAHVGQEIKSGPYRGLDRNFSAIEFSTVVFEQLNAYESIRRRGEFQNGIPAMDSELIRRGFYTDGVRESIAGGWDDYIEAEKQYRETCHDASVQFQRSDLTTANSLKLYTSFFSPDQHMTTPDLSVLLGEKPSSKVKIKPGHVDLKYRGSGFVAKAAKKGIVITNHKDLEKSQPLFSFGRKDSVPAGFEMINEDLYSRKENKFMVFNGPGVESWGDTPVTKTVGIEKMLASTL